MDFEYIDNYSRLFEIAKIINPEMCKDVDTGNFLKFDWVYDLLDSLNDFLSIKSNDFSKIPRLKKVVSRLKKMCDSYTEQLDSIDEQNDNFEYLDEDDIEEMGLEEDFDSNEEDFDELRDEIFEKIIKTTSKYFLEFKLLRLQKLENKEIELPYIPNDIIKEGEFYSKNLLFLAFLILNERDNEPLTFHIQNISFSSFYFNLLAFLLVTKQSKQYKNSKHTFSRSDLLNLVCIEHLAVEDYIFKMLQILKENELITSYSFFIKDDDIYLDIKFDSQHIYNEINKNKISRDICIQYILKTLRENKSHALGKYLNALRMKLEKLKGFRCFF